MISAVLFCIAVSVSAVECDIVIRGATLHDGTGEPARKADVAVRGDRIVAVGDFEVEGAPREISADGLILAPGFIDLHNHSDRSITRSETRQNTNYLMQGVTTVVTGNCGGGRGDVAKYLSELDEHPPGTNVAHLIPHGALRKAVMADVHRQASPQEVQELCRRVETAMQDGAFGISTGLIYVPGSYATTNELAAAAESVARHRGIYVSHIRNENTRLLEAVEEALTIGRRAKLPVHISHFKASGRDAWGLAREAVELVKEARREGHVVTADQYPYIASSTSLAAMIVPEAYRSQKAFQNAYQEPEKRATLETAMRQGLARRGDGDSLFVASYAPNRKWQGKSLATLAHEQSRTPLDVAIEIQRNGGASMVNFGMDEAEVRLIMQQPFVATASDGSARQITSNTVPHPRSYGCFPRKIGYYSIQGEVLPCAQAIRSASGLPADILSLPERGYIRKGYFADLVLFDPASFRDTATFEKPHQYATGVHYLFVNGKLAIDDGELKDIQSGRALRSAGAEERRSSLPPESADMERIFNGKDLAGWDGDPRLWSVEQGVIRGETTPEKAARGNTFLIWTKGKTKDFDLRLSFRCTAANNSGIQYRSKRADGRPGNKWIVRGYQYEIRNETNLPSVAGFIYDEGGKRGRTCLVGEKAVWAEGGKKVTDKLIDAEGYKELFRVDDWNDVAIIAHGNHIQHYLNGRLILDFKDDPELAYREGVLALQLHAGRPMWAEFKDIRIKHLD